MLFIGLIVLKTVLEFYEKVSKKMWINGDDDFDRILIVYCVKILIFLIGMKV